MKRFLKSLELFSRNAIVYPLLNLLLKRKPIDQKVDINQIKKILIFRHDRIGDIIVTTPIFRKLKRANPSLFIGVTASPANAEIIQENRNVDKIYVLHKGIISRLRMILKMRSENYNVILNFVFTSTSWGALMSALISSKAIRVGHGLEKHKSYYDKFLIIDRLKYHMVESLSEFLLQVFCIEMQQSEYVYEIPISQTARINVERFLHHHKLCKRDERIPNRS